MRKRRGLRAYVVMKRSPSRLLIYVVSGILGGTIGGIVGGMIQRYLGLGAWAIFTSAELMAILWLIYRITRREAV
jgi:hypothetical protein